MADDAETAEPVHDDALSIGEAIALLRDEFPDVSVSKLRFLESQGLLSPGRSEGGYRLFDEHDLERVRFILRQQRDHFLPLKVIKSKLTLWERGEEIPEMEGATPTRLLDRESQHVTRNEMLRRSSLSDNQLQTLEEHGLIGRAVDDLYPAEALSVAVEARALFSQGLEARHLRTIRHAAEREADILSQLTAALRRMRNAEAQEQARNILEASGEAMMAVHKAILTSELRKLLDS